MKILFVYYAFENQGSGLVIQGYTEAAEAMGHHVAVYGPPDPNIPLNYTTNVGSADAVVFIFEWTTEIRYADPLHLARIFGRIPRSRRVIIDGDGNYNDVVNLKGDFNHPDAESGRRWTEFCETLTDKICQPTLRPLRENVRPFLFYAYNPRWSTAFDPSRQEYGMLYVGHCKFRWDGMQEVLDAVQPIRRHVGRIGLVGYGWDSQPWWAEPLGLEAAYVSNPEYLDRQSVEVLPPVPFGDVIDWMGRARFNPILTRPTFAYMKLVTPRYFETPAAGTVPLFVVDEAHVAEIYGEVGKELVLQEEGTNRIMDIMNRPEHYADVVAEIQEHLALEHSHAARLHELIEIIES